LLRVVIAEIVLSMQTQPIELRALAESIRDYRPADLYADDEAWLRWFQLCNVAALALCGDDQHARKRFLDLCEIPAYN